VILSAAMPSRLLSAFPPEVQVVRVSLDVAIARVARRLGSGGEGGAQLVAQADEAIDVE
jgi:ATP-dependent DNA helicase DinG